MVSVCSKGGCDAIGVEWRRVFPEPRGVPPEAVSAVVASHGFHALHKLGVAVYHVTGMTCTQRPHC